jgi:hypothetical protein
MSVTIPLGRRTRLIIGHSRDVGWWAARWRRPPSDDWGTGWDEDPPDAGVREPLHPRPSPRGGAVQLPEPD